MDVLCNQALYHNFYSLLNWYRHIVPAHLLQQRLQRMLSDILVHVIILIAVVLVLAG